MGDRGHDARRALEAARAAGAAAAQRQADALRAAGEAWARFAQRIGAPPPGITASALPFLEGALDGVRWRLRVVRDEQGWTHTQCFADALAPVDAEVGAYSSPAGFLDWVKSHFEEDIDIGDPPFDRAFVIRARPTWAAASLLSPDVRELMMTSLGQGLAGLSYKDGTVALQWRGTEREPDVLEAAVRLVAIVARWRPE